MRASNDRDGIVVRVIKYKLDDPQRVGHGEEHTLAHQPAGRRNFIRRTELISGYHERWEHELVYDEQKTHQDPRRATKPANLRSETPAGVIQELYALSLGHFVVRALMFEAAEREHLDPGSALLHRLFPDPAMPFAGMRRAHAAVFSAVVRIAALGTRPGTHRAASQPHQSPRDQTEDVQVAEEAARASPPAPLTKTFDESVVMVT